MYQKTSGYGLLARNCRSAIQRFQRINTIEANQGEDGSPASSSSQSENGRAEVIPPASGRQGRKFAKKQVGNGSLDFFSLGEH